MAGLELLGAQVACTAVRWRGEVQYDLGQARDALQTGRVVQVAEQWPGASGAPESALFRVAKQCEDLIMVK